MDPDATLDRLRALVRQHNDADRRDPGADLDAKDVDSLVDLVEALDGWLSKGGFLPTDWNALRVTGDFKARP